jgi:hypothetical protein
MHGLMTKEPTRIRITIDCDEVIKRAFSARASLEGLSPQQLFDKIVREYCPDEVATVERQIEANSRKPKK